jgi:hypothetical protein
MTTEILDATIEAMEPGRKRGKAMIFPSITLRDTSGQVRTLKKYCATSEVGALIAPAQSGRFYLFTALDIKGFHGVRTADGTASYGYPGAGNRIIGIITTMAGLAYIALRLAMGKASPCSRLSCSSSAHYCGLA